MLMFVSLASILGVSSALQYGGLPTGQVAGYVHKAVPTQFVGALNHNFVGLPYLSAGLAGGVHGPAPVAPLPVQTAHNVKYHDVPSGGHVNPVGVDIFPNVIPVNMMFRSASSFLNVKQTHHGAPGSAQETVSQDEPHLLRHSVQKPVIQEIREIVKPYRKIVQEVHPVHEKIETVVARAIHHGGPVASGYPAGQTIEQHVIEQDIGTGGAGLGIGAAGHAVPVHGGSGIHISHGEVSGSHGGLVDVAGHGAIYAPGQGAGLVGGQGYATEGVAHQQVYAHQAPTGHYPIEQQIVHKQIVEQPIVHKQIVEQPIIQKQYVAHAPTAYVPQHYAVEQPIIQKQYVSQHVGAVADSYPVHAQKYASYAYKK